jgi:hypothetical protein
MGAQFEEIRVDAVRRMAAAAAGAEGERRR